MLRKLMQLGTSLTAILLFSGTLAHGTTPVARSEAKQDIVLITPNIVVGSVTIDGKSQTVIVIKGRDAKELKKQCGCESAEFPKLNLIILLDDSMEI